MDALRDIRLSLLCLFWYVFCVYTYAHARTLNYIAREYILYSAWASRCRFRYQGNARASSRGTGKSKFHAFLLCLIGLENSQVSEKHICLTN